MILEKHKKSAIILLAFSFLLYTFFIYTHLPQAQTAHDIAAQNGKMIWQNKNCNSCHQMYGLGGYLGPDLTNVYSKKGSNYIKAFLKSGTQIMPNFHLSEHEMNALVAFLKETDATGNGDPKSFILNYDGTIQQ